MPSALHQPAHSKMATDNVVMIRPALAQFKEVIMTGSPKAADKRKSAPAKSAATKPYAEPLGMPPSIEMRHPNELEIDDSYQRSTDTETSRRLISKIARGWDWRMCLPLVVSRRDDGFYVIDGQHRLAAAKLRGDIPYLPCCISTYGSVADEAQMFVLMNRVRKAINVADDFHASIASGDPQAAKISAMIADVGFTVARSTGKTTWAPGAVSFTSAIANAMKKHGEAVCHDALRLMSEAFPDEVLMAGSPTFRALVKLAVNDEAPDRDRLFRALLTETQKGWSGYVSKIKGGGEDRAYTLKQAFLMAYEDVGESQVEEDA